MSDDDIAIRGLATVWGEREMPASELAALQGCSIEVVERAVGDARVMVSDGRTPTELGVAAAKRCMERCGVTGPELDAIVCMALCAWDAGSPVLRYQRELGATNVSAGYALKTDCTTPLAALRMASALVRAEPQIRRVLVVAGATYGHQGWTRSMLPLREDQYNLVYSDGGFAAIVERGPGVALLGYGGAGLGDLTDHLPTLMEGTTEQIQRLPSEVQVLHQCRDIHRQALRSALAAAGITIGQIDHVLCSREAVAQAERSILRQLGIEPERLFRLPGWPTHTAVADQGIALEALLAGVGKPGQHVLVLARTYGLMQCAVMRLGAR